MTHTLALGAWYARAVYNLNNHTQPPCCKVYNTAQQAECSPHHSLYLSEARGRHMESETNSRKGVAPSQSNPCIPSSQPCYAGLTPGKVFCSCRAV